MKSSPPKATRSLRSFKRRLQGSLQNLKAPEARSYQQREMLKLAESESFEAGCPHTPALMEQLVTEGACSLNFRGMRYSRRNSSIHSSHCNSPFKYGTSNTLPFGTREISIGNADQMPNEAALSAASGTATAPSVVCHHVRRRLPDVGSKMDSGRSVANLTVDSRRKPDFVRARAHHGPGLGRFWPRPRRFPAPRRVHPPALPLYSSATADTHHGRCVWSE